MFDALRSAGEGWREALADLDPEGMVGTQPARALAVLREVERATAAARLAVTARAERMHPWQREGYRSFEDWLAAQEGTSTGAARRRAGTARKLRAGSGRTADALRKGTISEDQAETIADAAAKNPGAEQELLDTAENEHRSDKDLRKRAADAKAAVEDDRARAARLRRGRRVGWGLDRDGFWRLSGRFQPEVGAELKAALLRETDRVFARGREAGTREPVDRYRADALANLILGPHPDRTGTGHGHGPGSTNGTGGANGTGQSTSPDPDTAPGRSEPTSRAAREIIIDIDLAALRRGCVRPGETCTVRGVGPVPVEVARAWVHDAFLKAVIRDGTDIKRVAHLGRHLPAEVRTALGVLDHHTCQVPGCDSPRTEYDHATPYAHGGACSVTNLRALCPHHHRQRTHHGYELHGQPGDRRWLDPDGRVLSADNPDPTAPARAP